MTEKAERSDNTLLLDIWQKQGTIEAQLAFLIQAQGEAVESRKSIHGKLEDFGLIAATVRRLEPIVSELDRIRERAIGMQIAMKLFWLVFGAIAACAGFVINAWLYGGKPH